jgi:hypothetical protein
MRPIQEERALACMVQDWKVMGEDNSCWVMNVGLEAQQPLMFVL